MSKTCSLDPLPTKFPAGIGRHTAAIYICAMCNASLREGSLLATQKMAIITPVVKKPGLDPEDGEETQNYRPISNLTFISKVIERIVANQIKTHLAFCAISIIIVRATARKRQF